MIAGDSTEYELISEEISKLNLDPVVLTCEIGLRRGLGSKTIMDAIISRGTEHYRHIAIDPYGNLNYQHYDDKPPYTADYTDSMKIETLYDLVKYKEFAFFEFPDTYFFETMSKGYPISIDGNTYLKDKYTVVHLDGPHTTNAVNHEISFFKLSGLPKKSINPMTNFPVTKLNKNPNTLSNILFIGLVIPSTIP